MLGKILFILQQIVDTAGIKGDLTALVAQKGHGRQGGVPYLVGIVGADKEQAIGAVVGLTTRQVFCKQIGVADEFIDVPIALSRGAGKAAVTEIADGGVAAKAVIRQGILGVTVNPAVVRFGQELLDGGIFYGEILNEEAVGGHGGAPFDQL
jgi:hypothetical protein